jgi:hypothetical protein
MWAAQWVVARRVDGELCRGCVADSAAKRQGQHTVRARMTSEIRETDAGKYCVSCFARLPPCPVCGIEPTSHAEYPCAACEVAELAEQCVVSGGRDASPTYRGWSSVYNGKGQNNGGYPRGRSARRVHER